jgi:hypothetical protein
MCPAGFHPLFMLVLLIVFGTTLFSCTDKNNRTVGELAITNPIAKTEATADSNLLNFKIDTTIQFQFNQLYTIENIHTVGIMEMPRPLPEVNFVNQVVDTAATADSNLMTETGCTPQTEIYTTTGAIVSVINKSANAENENILSADTVLPLSTGLEKAQNENHPLENNFALYPNPAAEIVNISCSIRKPSTLTITLYEVNGKIINHIISNNKLSEQDYSIPVSVENLKPGVYFVSIVDGEEVSSLRFVKE